MTTLAIVLLIITAIFVGNVFLAAVVVFFERRNPASTWAWIFVLFYIPVFGFLIYLIFGRNSSKLKVFEDKTAADRETLFSFVDRSDELAEQIEMQVFSNDGLRLGNEYKYLCDFATLNINSGSWLTYNNDIRHFTDGIQKFNSLLKDIENAKHFIHLEYYIFRGDELGKRIIDALAKKAAQGVEVRLLYDYMGNRGLPKNFFKKLTDAGGEAASFPVPILIRINCRNHRKIAVIDGKIGYVGGFNVGMEYLGKVKRFGPWRDTHVRFEGEVVSQLQIRFLMDWNYSSENNILQNDFYFPDNKIKNYIPAQIVCSGPDTQWRNVKNSYFKMINEA